MFSKLRVVLIVFRAMLDPSDYTLLSLALEGVLFLYALFIFTFTNLSSSDSEYFALDVACLLILTCLLTACCFILGTLISKDF